MKRQPRPKRQLPRKGPKDRCKRYPWCIEGPNHHDDEHGSAVHMVDLHDGRQACMYLSTASPTCQPRMHLEIHHGGMSTDELPWVNNFPVDVAHQLAVALYDLASSALTDGTVPWQTQRRQAADCHGPVVRNE